VEDADGAGARLDALLKSPPITGLGTVGPSGCLVPRGCRAGPKAARYYRVCSTRRGRAASIAETREVADGLVRMAGC